MLPGVKTKPLSLFPLLALAALLSVPVSSFAQSILQSAGNFALLGATEISNTGNTIISNGNVGSQVGVSGFFASDGGPGVILNGSYVIPGTVVNQAEADLGTAHTGLDNMTSIPANNFTSSGELGGRTLTPGVYTFNVAADLTGALVLNAENESNVAFVIQIGTTLTAAANASVSIENAGSNDGIFFAAGTGAFNFGNNDTLVGNYISGTAVTFGTGDSIDGRALALTGVTFAGAGLLNAQGEIGGGDYTGGLMLQGTSVVATSIPEPAAFLWLAPLGVMGFVIWRRHSLRVSSC
jgi:hypothetical protein